MYEESSKTVEGKGRTFGEILEVTFYDDRERGYNSDTPTVVRLGGTYDGKDVLRISVDHTPEGYPTVTLCHQRVATILPGVKIVQYSQEFRV